MKPSRLLIAFALAALSASASADASARHETAPAPCPDSALDLPARALAGQWQARIEGEAEAATVELAPHPDYEGVRGTIAHAGQARAAQIAGDIGEDGRLAIDESNDGQRISASWSARMAPGSCGRVFEGIWRDAANAREHRLELRRNGS